MRVLRTVALGMAMGLLVLSGCIVDEKEPGPNVYKFTYAGFQGRGNVDTATDTDEWDLSATSATVGDFEVTIGLAPRGRASVRIGSAPPIVFSCPSNATA